MALERKWFTISKPFIANGTLNGVIKVLDVAGFFVKQRVKISATALPDLNLEIKRVDDTDTITVGPIDSNIESRSNLTAYTTIAGSVIYAAEQEFSFIKPETIVNATYERDPTKAWRVIDVDQYGRPYNKDNPKPVDATLNVGSINVEIADPTTPKIVNISVPLANTEQSYLLPANTKRFVMRVRDGLAQIKLAYVSGTTGTVYRTVDMGASYESGLIDAPSGFTVYFQLTKASKIIEIESWAI